MAPFNDFSPTLEDTAGAIKSLPNATLLENATVRSISYLSATTENTTDCKPLLFLFYDEQNRASSNDVFLTPGQTSQEWECYTVYGFFGYSGVTLLD